MQSKILAKNFPKASFAPVALLIFLCFQYAVSAQVAFANIDPGSASFSTNWGAPQSGQNERQVVKQRTFRERPSTPSVRQNSYVGLMSVETPQLPLNPTSQPTVPGNRAVLRHGVAYAPENAPLAVKRAIWAINTIRTKPYVWGGGHDSFYDPRGYDCSGTVSFALHYAGQLSSPTDSRSLRGFGEAGAGRWMTIYARDGHTWMVIAGLRLDTTGYYGNEGPRWRPDGRSAWGFTARHPVGL